jgi:membrane associated rhomboid family serine protease
VFVPIYDLNPLKRIRFQYVTVALIILNIAVFALEQSGVDTAALASFAVVPAELFQVHVLGPGPAPVSADGLPVPERVTLLTYMFLHNDPFHLLGNMIFLWVFGDNVEDALGHLRYFFFYLACGVIGALTHAYMQPASTAPLIGASGAVAGVIAAYIMLHPYIRVWVLAFKIIPLRISAALALGAWIATQVVMVALPHTGPVAWWAHIGGLIAGAALVCVLRQPGVALFQRPPAAPVAGDREPKVGVGG